MFQFLGPETDIMGERYYISAPGRIIQNSMTDVQILVVDCCLGCGRNLDKSQQKEKRFLCSLRKITYWVIDIINPSKNICSVKFYLFCITKNKNLKKYF